MTSLEGFEPVAISPQKQDPGWKHCQLYIKTGDPKVELKKCLYCGKVFQGGGINRFKSHLAGRKGNGPICDQVPPDVRVSMLQCLDEKIASLRHRKSQMGVNPSRSFSELDNVFAENEVGGPNLMNQEEDVGMSVDNGIRVGDNLTDVPLEIDDCFRSDGLEGLTTVPLAAVDLYKGNALGRKAGVPNYSFSENQEEGVDRRVGWRGGTSFVATTAGFGSGSANATKLSYVPAPIRSEVDKPFYENTQGRSVSHPNSYLFENETDVGTSNTNGKNRKRVRDENGSMVANAGTIGNNGEVEKVNSQQIHMAIGRFLYEIQAPLGAVKNSVYFQPMIDAIASGGMESKPPSYHDLRGWILNNVVEEVKNDIHQHMNTWERNGCSLLVNQLNSEKGRILLNFSVYSPQGTTYLKSVDASSFINSPDALYEILKQVLEEVGVGRVLQVITNSEEHYVVAGKRLMDTFPTLYWSPCAAACINLILEDFGKVEWIKSIIEQARSVTRFIYKHVVILNMMRRYTFGNDIVKVGVTRFATDFMTLKHMADLKFNLQTMVTSKEWEGCPYSQTSGGSAMLDVLSNHTFWSACIMITRLTNPLLRVLRIVGSQKKAAMGYVFGGMYRAKETIKRELVKKEEYMAYWNIIDYRWQKLWDLPLHAAGFYLNPKFFYSIKGEMHKVIMSKMLDCIEKLVPDLKVQDEISKEINLYKNAVGDLGRNLAIRARDTLLPAEWWSTYGGGCPNMARFAVHILSQTCSLIQCKENQIPFDQLHKTRNSLEHQRLSDFVFVQYNLQLRQMVHKNKEHEYVDPISFDNTSTVEDWVTETDMYLEDNENTDWKALEPPSYNSRLLELSVDEAEDLGSGFDDNEIFLNGLQLVKEERRT
ncbi:uncharacterized protein LOC133743245 [Rosa rugosa]|uniref:uncharacterized protein LOC133743245 n=1 Tax=Rosa rugosa TaxID=74645 RepID=UPI002B40F670|nr:uncharacterized protein LOC133743245 [Rosa rugosa]XP_062027104.1 uncharacterized protein LOC133743245 [Rosa rugosa]